MNSASTDLVNSAVNEDSWNYTSDFFLGTVQEIEYQSSPVDQPSNLLRWPFCTVDDITSSERPDQLSPEAPTFERIMEPTQARFLLFGLPGKPQGVCIQVVAITRLLSYLDVQEQVELPSRQPRFSPDFFKIKDSIAYVTGRSLASALKQQLPFVAKRDIPIAITPQVVREAEEKSLTEDLKTCIKLAQENYSSLKSIIINIAHDPEIVDRKTIQFTLTVSGDPALVLKDEFKFKENLYSTVDIQTCEQITTTYKWQK